MGNDIATAKTHQGPAFFFGTRDELRPGDRISPAGAETQSGKTPYLALTANLDEAIWSAEICAGEGPARVYLVEPSGPVGKLADLVEAKPASHPAMSCYSYDPLLVKGEVTQWLLYHGTRADLQPGDRITPGQIPNFGKKARQSHYVYFTRTLDAAIWGAELAAGAAPSRIYLVQPLGPVEDDPNLTNQKFRGNPTKSFRSRDPLQIIGELTEWQGHSPAAIQAMKEALAQLGEQEIEPLED